MVNRLVDNLFVVLNRHVNGLMDILVVHNRNMMLITCVERWVNDRLMMNLRLENFCHNSFLD